ncbi:LytR C-terminal domain-containing protein [Rhodococcus sp. BP22]|uniref:LytR C-terminal domain-containing protein n=1 Tax=Rhodococcus sp. BP22 TaxID=2758566 RepID=UPI00164654CE|nr:LytR C-terminal domain-containing protein [Rhodococcus sp. BP22]
MSSPNPESSGPPLRALAMVLISLAILFAAIGALSLTGSDETEESAAQATTSAAQQAPASSAAARPPAASQPPASATRTSAATPTGEPTDVEVRVLNNSNVSGLAAGTAATLTAEGWNVAETGNFSESQIAQTTIYYDTSPGAQAAAQQISTQLGVAAFPRPTTLSSFGEGVIVVVTE